MSVQLYCSYKFALKKSKPANWKWEQMECIEKYPAAEQWWCQSSGDIMRLWQSKLKLCLGLGIRQWMQRCGTDFSIGYHPNCSLQVTYLFSKPQLLLGLVRSGQTLGTILGSPFRSGRLGNWVDNTIRVLLFQSPNLDLWIWDFKLKIHLDQDFRTQD